MRVGSWVYAYPCMVKVLPCETGKKIKRPKVIMFLKGKNKKNLSLADETPIVTLLMSGSHLLIFLKVVIG